MAPLVGEVVMLPPEIHSIDSLAILAMEYPIALIFTGSLAAFLAALGTRVLGMLAERRQFSNSALCACGIVGGCLVGFLVAPALFGRKGCGIFMLATMAGGAVSGAFCARTVDPARCTA